MKMNQLTTKAIRQNIAVLTMTANIIKTSPKPFRRLVRQIVCLKSVLRIKEAQEVKLPLPYELQHKISHMTIMNEIKNKKVKDYSRHYWNDNTKKKLIGFYP